MTSIELERTRAPVDLKDLTEDELCNAIASADEGTLPELLAEEDRRYRLAQARKTRARREFADPAVTNWGEAAEAQFKAAEAACAGNLVRDGSQITDAYSLWRGPEWRARQEATEELNNWWDEHPRIPTVTETRRQEKRAYEISAEEAERTTDGLAEHEQRAVRRGDAPAGSSGGDPEVTRTPDSGAGGPVGPDRHPAGDASGTGDPGHVPGGPVTTPTAAEARAQRAANQAERAAAIRDRMAAGAEATLVPAAYRQPTAAVAVRDRGAVVQDRPGIDGGQVLRYLYTYLKHFACWGSDSEIVAATLWIAQAHARDGDGMPIWQYCARLGIFGPSGSGKSWKSRLIGKLAPSGKILIEPTKPSFIDLCADKNTVVLTEADELFATPGRNRGIIAVINAAYEPDRTAPRKQGGRVVEVLVFCHLVLDGLDWMLKPTRADLKTMISRCIILLAQRAPEGYRPPRFDKRARMTAELLSQRAAAWMAQEVQDGMADDVPVVPEHLGNRPFALWEPLFTVALRADKGDPEGPWSRACAEACEQLEKAAGVPDETEEATDELDRSMEAYGLGGSDL